MALEVSFGQIHISVGPVRSGAIDPEVQIKREWDKILFQSKANAPWNDSVIQTNKTTGRSQTVGS